MPSPLPRLRPDLDILPSPTPERPGLLLRDPFRFTDVALIIPPALVRALSCFDGQRDLADLRASLERITGRPDDAHAIADSLLEQLSGAGFLHDETFRQLRAERHERFRRETVRGAAFAGGAYPAEADELTRTLDGWLKPPTATTAGTRANAPAAAPLGIAAPHASPFAGVDTYRAAYRALDSGVPDCTFVVLGTSHYGALDRFGLTHKTFETPLGSAVTDRELVDRLAVAAPGAIEVEDYCHAVEHSIEFQVVFLQRLFGPGVRILPILCGAFSSGASRDAPPGDPGARPAPLPEAVPAVRDALGALAELQTRDGHRLRWVLGVDMAHVGPRYGDAESVRAGQGAMVEVAARDHARLARVTAGDAAGFWNLLHERGADDLKWCGSSPLYTFMRAAPNARGRVLHYHQWNIDESSVVSFAALEFEHLLPDAARTG